MMFMPNPFIRKCPNCSHDLEKGVIKFIGNLKWQTTEFKNEDQKKYVLDGKRRRSYIQRSAISAEKCNNCDLVVFYQRQ